MIVGKGLFRCSPVFPIAKEAREGRRQRIGRLKGDWKQAVVQIFDKLKISP